MDRIAERVVVGYDGGEPSGEALDWAAAEAARRDVPLTVVHVVHLSELALGPAALWPVASDWAETAAGEVTDAGVERARKVLRDGQVHALTVTGNPVRVLAEESRQAALLVVGHRGHGALAGAFLGSVALGAATHAHCPVAVVRGETPAAGPDRPVLVAVDGGPAAWTAVRHAAGAAAERGAPLVVLSVWHSIVDEPLAVPPPAGTPGAVDLDRRARAQALTAATAAADLTASLHPDLAVSTRVVPGRPARAIEEQARQSGAGLLVVGCRARSAAEAALLGHVTQRLLRSAPCPVLVVREDAAGDTSRPGRR